MFEKLADLFKKFCTYGVSSIIAKFLNYLLVPLYTYTISAESGGYGMSPTCTPTPP